MLNYFFRLLLALSIITGALPLHAQQVEGGFQADSMKVGAIKAYSLTARYAKTQQVVFPDSLYDYRPFELVEKKWFPTKTDSLSSLDSAVYYLRSFEVDTVQYLSLPVFQINGQDSLPVYAATDSLHFIHTVTVLPDSLALKTFDEFLPVETFANYLYWAIGITLALIIILILVLTFRKKVVRAVKIYRLKRRHKRFEREFQAYIDQLKQEQNTKSSEAGLHYWKQYMEKLARRPYTSATSREILGMASDAQLSAPLRAIDRSIYGDIRDTELHHNFEELKQFAHRQYEKKKEELKNE